MTVTEVYDDLIVSAETFSMKVGETTTIQITSGSGEYGVTNLNSEIAKATLQGTTISINGVSVGKAHFVVTDILSGQMATIEVTVTQSGGGTSYLTCPDDHHPHAIDLGLPSGTKWACCNVGATTPGGYGDYFAWGETRPKDVYNWGTYFDSSFEKYNNNGGLTELLPEDDAAIVNWGATWRMPTISQQQELMDNCYSEWTERNGVNGRLVTGPNGGQIFLPAAGYRWDGELDGAVSCGYYWSSSLFPDRGYYAFYMYFHSGYLGWNDWYRRYRGFSVRPVCVQQ